jgi:hypothetical protein
MTKTDSYFVNLGHAIIDCQLKLVGGKALRDKIGHVTYEIGDEFHYVLQCPSLHDDRRRLLDSTYLTRVNVLKFANLFQSRNKIKLRHLCKFIKIIFSKIRPPG